jgi:hypothetical protein
MFRIWELERHPTRRLSGGQAERFHGRAGKNPGVAFGLLFLLDYGRN